jgi:hypothetical protein
MPNESRLDRLASRFPQYRREFEHDYAILMRKLDQLKKKLDDLDRKLGGSSTA